MLLAEWCDGSFSRRVVGKRRENGSYLYLWGLRLHFSGTSERSVWDSWSGFSSEDVRV